MKRFIKAFLPPSIVVVPMILFAIAVAVVPTKPDIPGWLSPKEKEWAMSDYSIKNRQAITVWATIAAAVTIGAMIFFLPTTVAGLRDAPSYIGILIINVVGGPFLLGWIAALIWAFVDSRPQPVVVQNIYPSPAPPPP